MGILIVIGRLLGLLLFLLPLLLGSCLAPKKFRSLLVVGYGVLGGLMINFPSMGRILFLAGAVLGAVIIILIVIMSHDSKALRKSSGVQLGPLDLWLNAAGGVLSAANGADTQRLMLHLAGNPGTKLRRIAVRRMLKNYWEITDHDTAVEEMSELLTMGMRMQFHVMMEIQEQRAVLGVDSGPDRSQRGGEKDLPVPEESGLQARLLSAWRRQGPNALLGWDLGRLACNAQYCYLAGYLSREELDALGMAAYDIAQENCSGWEELMESYMLGFQFWCGEDEDIPGSKGAERRAAYEKLRAEQPSIFQMIPWSLPVRA